MHRLEVTERILHLRTMPMFREMSSVDLAPVARAVRARTFEKGEVLLREDEGPRSFFLVGSGTVTMRRKGHLVGHVRGPSAAGFLGLLAQSAGGTECRAESYVETYEVRSDVLDEVFEDHFAVMLATMRWVADRMIRINIEESPSPYIPPEIPLDHLVGDRPLGIVERIFVLRRARAMMGANVNSLARYARTLEEIRVPAGTTLWREGDPSGGQLFIVKGMARIAWDGKVRDVGPGYILGGAEALLQRPRWNALVSETPLIALRGQHDRLVDMFEDDHEVARKFLATLATYLVSLWDAKAERGIAPIDAGPLYPPLRTETLPPPPP